MSIITIKSFTPINHPKGPGIRIGLSIGPVKFHVWFANAGRDGLEVEISDFTFYEIDYHRRIMNDPVEEIERQILESLLRHLVTRAIKENHPEYHSLYIRDYEFTTPVGFIHPGFGTRIDLCNKPNALDFQDTEA